MPFALAGSHSSSQPAPSTSSVLTLAQDGPGLAVLPNPQSSDLASALSEPGGIMKLKGTLQAIYAMSDVEYDERVIKRQEKGYPSRYGKFGERRSTMKLIFKHVGYRVRTAKRTIVRLSHKI